MSFQTVEKVQLSWAFSVFRDIMIWVMQDAGTRKNGTWNL